MRKNKKFFILIILALVIGGALFATKDLRKKADGQVVVEIQPRRGSIQTTISSTGTVLPKNRLEVKPPVNGRIESVLVKEGDHVKSGDILAWMSSTERAALLDAARGQGEETLKYWQEAYKPIPLPAPIDGEVIVATTQPGQTVTTADAVIVLSDRLIVRAQVDETDIGRVAVGMKAAMTVDAYPDTKIAGLVEHIYYESETVNNVTTYKVDLQPEHVPVFFRSGMNVTVDFIEQGKENALLIPQEAVHGDGNESYVLVKTVGNGSARVRVALGMSDGKNVEVLSGVEPSDTLLLETQQYNLPRRAEEGTSPFFPTRRRR